MKCESMHNANIYSKTTGYFFFIKKNYNYNYNKRPITGPHFSPYSMP